MNQTTTTGWRERFRQFAEDVLAETRCTVEWTESREGTADRKRRHVTAPDIDSGDPVEATAVLLHELGHVAGPQDYPLGGGKWRGETVATMWALNTWHRNELPQYARAEYCLASRLGSYLRTAIREGNTTLEEIRSFVPHYLMPLPDMLTAPAYLSDMNEAQLLRAVKDEDSTLFPVGLTQAERFRFLNRLQDTEW